jgi:hypothetical protein
LEAPWTPISCSSQIFPCLVSPSSEVFGLGGQGLVWPWIKAFASISGSIHAGYSVVWWPAAQLPTMPLPSRPYSLVQILLCKSARPWCAEKPGPHALGLSHCRFISDAVTGVAIVIILFFFPSKRPSLKWWLDFKGKIPKAGSPRVQARPGLRPWASVAWSSCPVLTTWFCLSPCAVRVVTLSGDFRPKVTIQDRC